jgi:RimJ/RimL family protein N-acetyltransferase
MTGFRHDTARLTLRDWRGEDWPEFWRVTNTPAVMRWLADHGHTFWVVERREDSALLGFCGLKRSNQPGGPQGMMEVGWRLREDAWGKGYAREAAAASLALAFDRFGADEVVALTVARNTASWGLMERLGMARREDLDFASADFDAENPRIIAYAIARAGWEAA